LIDDGGFLENMMGQVVTSSLRLQNKPDIIFNKKYVFVYNKFHETIIYARNCKAIYKSGSSISLKAYLKDGNVSDRHKWKIVGSKDEA